MKQFLSIVLRNQFNLFYRFGYTFISKSQLVEFDGNINNKIKDIILEKFKTVTPFEYDVEYLILQLDKENTNESDFVKFEIEDITAVYPLSQQAKTSIESKIDQRIRLEQPIFETILPTIVTDIKTKEVEKAISALWSICKIQDPLQKYISKIGLENILNGLEFRKYGTKANKIQNGNYWEYLIAYDYYQYFPEGTIRYFYQLGEIFCYFKGKVDGIEGTKIEETLKQIGSGNFEQILQIFNKDNLPPSFIETMNAIGKSEFDPIIVSVLFLKWKADISNKDIDILNSSVFHKGKIVFIDKFPTEVKLALILLGAFFGFSKFYDNYYEALNLRFYKNYRTPKKDTEKIEQEQKVDIILEPEESVKSDIKKEHEKTTLSNDEENLSAAPSHEEPIRDSKLEVLPKNKKVESLDEKHSDSSNNHKTSRNTSSIITAGNNEVVSDITSKYQIIIEQALNSKFEIKYVDIPRLIKQRNGETIDKEFGIKITEQMSNVEKAKIGDVKKPNGIRHKHKTGPLFNE
jgi:hypothetical protein